MDESKISWELLEVARKQTLTELEFALEKPSQRADYFSEMLLYSNTTDLYEKEIEILTNASLNKVKEVHKKIFSQHPKISLIAKSEVDQEAEHAWLAF